MTSATIDGVTLESGPVGLGGWLLVMGVRHAIGLVVIIGEMLAAVDDTGLPVFTMALLGLQALLIFFYLNKRKEYVTAYVVMNGGMLALCAVAAMIVGTPEALGGFIGLCIGELPFMAYVIWSKRVRNTFTRGE